MESNGINISGDPYEAIVDLVKQWIDRFPTMFHLEDYIVWVWTENLGFDTVYLEYDGTGFIWNTDWYEGGSCKLLGFCPLSSVNLPDEYAIKETNDDKL